MNIRSRALYKGGIERRPALQGERQAQAQPKGEDG